MSAGRLLLTTSRNRLSSSAYSKPHALRSTLNNTTTATTTHGIRHLSSRKSSGTSPRSSSFGSNHSIRLLRSGGNSSPDTDETQEQKSPEPYKSYEYPWATEPPSITRTVVRKDGEIHVSKMIDQAPPRETSRTKAWFPFSGIFSHRTSNDGTAEHEHASPNTSSVVSSFPHDYTTVDPSFESTELQKPSEILKQSISAHNDPFDDMHSLSEDERAAALSKQKQQISTQLSSKVQPVLPTKPSYVPLPTPTSELAMPETIITELPNGVRVVSQETYRQVSTVGVVSELGSRYETPGVNTGVTNLLELLAFGACSPEYPSAAAIAHTLQDWGATRFVSAGREQSLHCIDILRPNVDKAVHLLGQTLCQPEFPQEEVEEAKQAILFQSMPTVTPPDLYLQEALQRAAYGEHQQLGMPHFCPPDMIDKLTRQTCLDYWKSQFLANPKGLVVGGAGVDHDQLVRLVEDHFGHLQQQDENRVPLTLCRYQGGYAEYQIPPPPDYDPIIAVHELSAAEKDKRLTRVAVALETGGWHAHDDLVAACVLQTLLGGGSSFSAGGPGKGMYSRLYRQVLNAYSWAESAEAFTAFHSESGLIGIAGSTQPAHARDLTQVLSEHLARLATRTVTDSELSRARNMLKCNVLTQLESRLVLFEDMARQVLTYGHRECIQETCRKIDAISAADVQRIAVKGLQNGPPTLAAVGIDITHVPRHGEVSEWFRANAI